MMLKDIYRPFGLEAQVAETQTLAVLEGENGGADQLVRLELQDFFGVSRTPLRETFREIEQKGLVEIIPRKNTIGTTITRRKIEENSPIRAALEGLAAKLAASKQEDLKKIYIGYYQEDSDDFRPITNQFHSAT